MWTYLAHNYKVYPMIYKNALKTVVILLSSHTLCSFTQCTFNFYKFVMLKNYHCIFLRVVNYPTSTICINCIVYIKSCSHLNLFQVDQINSLITTTVTTINQAIKLQKIPSWRWHGLASLSSWCGVFVKARDTMAGCL